MSVRDLIPWARTGAQAPINYRGFGESPFLALHRDMNRLFDDVFRDFGTSFPMTVPPAFAAGWPSVEMSETDTEIKVTAEVPGLEQKDVEVLLADGGLVIRGEKRSDTEDKAKRISEHFYGRFERRLPLASEIQDDKVEAACKEGVLTITLPKTPQAASTSKRIEIKS